MADNLSQQSLTDSSSKNADKLLLNEINALSIQQVVEDDGTKNQKKKKKEKQPSMPLYRMFRFATKLETLCIIAACMLSAGIGAMRPVTIIILGSFLGTVGTVIATGSTSDLVSQTLPIVLTFVYMGVAVLFSAYITNCLWIITGEKQTRRIRSHYVHAILRQEMGWFDKSEEGSLNTRLATDTQLIQDGISEKFGILISCISQFLTGIIVAFVKGWRVGLVVLAVMPLIGGTAAFMGYFVKKYTRLTQDNYAHAGSVAEQAFSGLRTVYSFSLQNRFTTLYEARLGAAMKTGIRRAQCLGLGFGTFMFILFSNFGLAFWFGNKLSREGVMPGQNVLIAFMGMMMGTMGLLQVPPNLSAVSGGMGAAYKIFALIDRVPSIDVDSAEGLTPEKLTGEIEFKDVKFSYPTRPDTTILKKLNLSIKPGQTVAFVGPSGSGKSTAVQLLQRFYDVEGGSVLVDGKDIRKYSVSWLRAHIGVVSQEPVLFNMTIKQNLLMGVDHEVSNEEIMNACKDANCHTFISELPDGYDSIVGEHGGMLSGGQKQRIAIARAILKNPSILLLDEATSALDTQSERLVQAALDKASADRTTIVIAHRLSTIRNADVIVVLQAGDLIEQGSHNELIALDGVYADLVRKQEINTKQVGEPVVELDADELLKREQLQILAEKEHIDDTKLDEKDTTVTLFRTMSTASIDAHELKIRKEQEERKKIAKQSAPIGKVWRQMRSEWHLLAIGVFGAGLAGAVFPVYAFIFSRVITNLVSPIKVVPGPMSGTNLYSFCFVMIGIAAFVGFSAQLIAFEVAGERYTRRLRAQIFRAFLRQEVGFYDREDNTIGSLTARLAVDSKNVNELLTKVPGDIASIIVTAIVGLSIAFSASWMLTLVILGVAPFLVFATSFESRAQRGFESESAKANEQSGEVAGEAIKEIRTVAGLNKQSYFEDKYHNSTIRAHKLTLRRAYKSSVGYAMFQGIVLFLNAIAFYAGTQFIAHFNLGFTNMMQAILGIMMTAAGVGRGSVFTTTFAKAKYSAIAIFDILERVPQIDPDLEGIEPNNEQVRGEIDFQDVAFTYPARPEVAIFSGELNLHAGAGQTIAIVGPSGCGKSTTIGILQRWYDVSGGSVRLDDSNVNKYTLRNLRSHMALVGQEPTLFDDTIGENIRYGIDEGQIVTDQDVENAARAANIHMFIDNLPQKYDTRAGDKGSQLSGGQKQRIAIARALIRKPKVLLLDEATSALDSESEKLVQAAIDNIIEEGGRTTITIAHRLSTVQNADLIYVVKDGRVIEQGTHWQLLKEGGLYKELVYQQSLNAH